MTDARRDELTRPIERHDYDVVVIGAGGAGLRAAIEAREQGMRTAIICKSLFGKAHTVMAEGGIAAAMGNVNPQRQLAGPLPRHHARRQVPQQLADGRAARQGGAGPGLGAGDLRRAVRPHHGRQDQPAQLRRPRVPAAGPRRRPHRPGADPHPAAEDRLAAAGGRARAPATTRRSIKVFAECTITELLKDGDGGSPAPSATGARPAGSSLFDAPAVILATGGIGKSFKVTSQLLGVHRRRARAGAAGRRDADQHGVRPVPPDRHGLAAVGEGHPRHRVGPRRRRRAAQLRGQAVHVRLRPGRVPRRSTPRPRRRPTAGTPTRTTTSARRSCCPRDEVARAINSEVKAGRGIAARRRVPRHRVPAAGRGDPAAAAVDAPPVQGAGRRRHHRGADGGRPDLPLRDGRRRGRPGHRSSPRCPACSRPARSSGGMHGSNRLGGNSLSDLLVFGRRAGVGAADYVDGLGGSRPGGRRRRRRRRGRRRRWRRSSRQGGENPYTLHQDCSRR